MKNHNTDKIQFNTTNDKKLYNTAQHLWRAGTWELFSDWRAGSKSRKPHFKSPQICYKW